MTEEEIIYIAKQYGERAPSDHIIFGEKEFEAMVYSVIANTKKLKE